MVLLFSHGLHQSLLKRRETSGHAQSDLATLPYLPLPYKYKSLLSIYQATAKEPYEVQKDTTTCPEMNLKFNTVLEMSPW